jgi:hypothetical protein
MNDTTNPSWIRQGLRRWVSIPSLAALTLTAGAAVAAITAVNGMAVQVAPPATVLPGLNMGPAIQAFDELQNVLLPVDLPIDARGTNPFTEIDSEDDLNPGKIPAGTCVSSHYIHYDPNGAGGAIGGVEFDGPILGVAVLPATLDATNVLGWPWTAYPADADAGTCLVVGATCAPEFTGPDVVRVGLQRVEVDFSAGNPGDRVRVITRGCCDCRCR